MKHKKILAASLIIASAICSNITAYGAVNDITKQDNPKEINDLQSNTVEEEIAVYPDDYSIAMFSQWVADSGQYNEYYYDQLPEIEKYIYDCINTNIDSIIGCDNPFIVDVSNFNVLYSQIKSGDLNWSRPIFTYFDFDHCEKFGVNYFNLGLSISGIPINNGEDYKVTQLGIYFGGSNATSSILEYNNVKEINDDKKILDNNVNKIISSIPKYASRYKKAQIINDWLVKNNTYNPYVYNGNNDAASKRAWDITSALVYTDNTSDDTKYPVCEGYSNAFKYLCDKVGIPCVSVESSTHKWNLIKLEDGNWYHVDVTWNDPVGATNYSYINKYFLLGSSNSLIKNSDHTINMTNPTLTSPVASTKDYSYKNAHNGDVNQDYLIDYTDVALMLKHISGKSKITNIGSSDINSDNVIDFKDVIQVLNLIKAQ